MLLCRPNIDLIQLLLIVKKHGRRTTTKNTHLRKKPQINKTNNSLFKYTQTINATDTNIKSSGKIKF